MLSFSSIKYEKYLSILKQELVPALGCTEPIAIAYAASKAREVLGTFPDRIIVKCSGSIIKNAKSVTIPNTGNLRGIKAAAIAGVVAGDSSKLMQVLEGIKDDDIEKIKKLENQGICDIEILDSSENLHIIVEVINKDQSACVEIVHSHINIRRICKNGNIIYENKLYHDSNIGMDCLSSSNDLEENEMDIKSIYTFANCVKIEDIKEMMDKQINYNLAIAQEGLKSKYGANIGKMLLECYGEDVFVKIRAYAAAGSDARMSGCSLPVVINSGSGNQGITASLPVIIYCKEHNIDAEKMYRALVLSNLITIHQKSVLGKLSAYCGVVSAACGSGAAITYLAGGTLEHIEKTIVNTLANVSGIVCDGAKASCAAKIASSIDAAILAHFMAMRGQRFEPFTGIVKETADKTICAVGRLGREGMKETDKEVLKIMLDN